MLRFSHALAMAALTACASAGSGSGAPRDTSVITREEIAASMEPNAYEVVARLRPLFLKSRGRTSITGSQESDYATVFVDGQRYGDLASLRNLPATQIQLIRHLGGPDAVTKYGREYGSGAIDVFTRQ